MNHASARSERIGPTTPIASSTGSHEIGSFQSGITKIAVKPRIPFQIDWICSNMPRMLAA